MISDLVKKQQDFVLLVSRLITFTYKDCGWSLTFGECYRTPEQAKWNAAHGLGIANSLHTSRLAIDLNLWTSKGYSSDINDYKVLGAFWKNLSSGNNDCYWGGDFIIPDMYHFSISHGGVK